VAARLKAAVRPTDIVYRLGGDEFALLQTDGTSGDGGQVVARRICRLIAEPFEVAGHRLLIGASVGIAAIKPEVPDATALLKAADIALYLAKSEGRGTYREYSAELNDAISQRLSLENDLRMAIEREQLELHYQPKVRLNDGCRTTGYEALVRWRHPERGLVPPNDFIPLAEETGLIVQLGEWVLMRACRDLVAKSPNHTVAVNVSAVQFKRGVVTEVVQRALVLSGLEPSRLEIEITESMLMNDDALVQEQLDALRALGVHIALDDFGTGYSSLSYLERYPIDSVKIDRSFVAKLGTAPRAAAIIKAIIALVGELGMVPVAEGVEHKEQADLLETLGCELAQGYLFGKPQPAASIWPEGERHAA
jgi:predicted signal transduction protein with EAL and GGDEF domain